MILNLLVKIILLVLMVSGWAVFINDERKRCEKYKVPQIIKDTKVKWTGGPLWYEYILEDGINGIWYNTSSKEFELGSRDFALISYDEVLIIIKRDQKIRNKLKMFI